MQISENLDEFIRRMPKVELHVHLEGTIQPKTLLHLARKFDLDLPVRDESEIAAFYQFRDFDHFIEIYIAACTCLRTPEDFALIVRELGAEAARQNIRYLEVHFNPEPHVRKRGLSFRDLLAGMNAGRAEVAARHGIEFRWIADGVRDAESGPSSVLRTVEWIVDLPPVAGVIGLGLGGAEVGNPPANFREAFALARAAGLHVVAHAGETTGPETIWSALHDLGVERIGHGISAMADPALVAHLAATGVPLEICPTSNLRTGVVPEPHAHPFAALDSAGVLVTVNSDDPPMFGTTLTDEYRFLATWFDYGAADLQRLALNAVHASFLPAAQRDDLATAFTAECAAVRTELDLVAELAER